MKLRYKIWLDKNGKAFGDGPLDILNSVERNGSLRKAAEEIGMSYSQVWNLINTLEKRLGFKLLKKRVGGQQGGGSELTEEAKSLIKRYKMFRQSADRALKELFYEFFKNS
ncbi:MAG: LysR family transcriptional regulator [Bacillota bacterium]|nr:LysR family transcriptional regulator [Bacillota bacterium]